MPQLEITAHYLRHDAGCWPASADPVAIAAARERLVALAERPPRGTKSQPVDIRWGSAPTPPRAAADDGGGVDAAEPCAKTRCEWIWREQRQGKRKGKQDVEQAPVRGDAATGPTVLFIHGGGFISGCTKTHKGLISRVLGEVGPGAHALSVEYRLAPEHSHPAAAEDVWAAYWWLRTGPKPVDPAQLVIVGDSAGAALAAGLVRELGRHAARQAAAVGGGARPVAAVLLLLSPWLDLSCSGRSYRDNAAFDHLPPAAVELAAELYASGARPVFLLAPTTGETRGGMTVSVSGGGCRRFAGRPVGARRRRQRRRSRFHSGRLQQAAPDPAAQRQCRPMPQRCVLVRRGRGRRCSRHWSAGRREPEQLPGHGAHVDAAAQGRCPTRGGGRGGGRPIRPGRRCPRSLRRSDSRGGGGWRGGWLSHCRQLCQDQRTPVIFQCPCGHLPLGQA